MSAATLTAPAQSTGPVRPKRQWTTSSWFRAVAGTAGFMLLLEILPRAGVVDRQFLPPFSEMMQALGQQVALEEFWASLGLTLRNWALGFSIAMVAGVLTGVLLGSVTFLRDATASTIEFLRPIPSVALIPLAVLLFGTDAKATLMLIVYACFWQVLVQVLYGVQDVDPVAQQTARCYGFKRVTVVRNVIWPTALPYVMTGFRLAATVALVLEITGEIIIGTPGLGNRIGIAQSSGAVPTMYALVIVAGVLGVLMNTMARGIQGRVLRWHPSMRGDRA